MRCRAGDQQQTGSCFCSEGQENLIPVGGNSQVNSAFVIGGNGRVEVDHVKRDGALSTVNPERHGARREQKPPRFQPLAVQDYHWGRRSARGWFSVGVFVPERLVVR